MACGPPDRNTRREPPSSQCRAYQPVKAGHLERPLGFNRCAHRDQVTIVNVVPQEIWCCEKRHASQKCNDATEEPPLRATKLLRLLQVMGLILIDQDHHEQ